MTQRENARRFVRSKSSLPVRVLFERCKRIESRVEAKMDELARVRSISTHITANYSLTGGGGGSVSSKIEVGMEQLDRVEERIRKELDKISRDLITAKKIIDELDDDRYRDILTWRYLNAWNWSKISEKMAYDRTNVWRLHGRALVKAQEVYKNMGSEQNEKSDGV